MWKDAVAASFNVLSWHLPWGTKENQQKPESGWSVGQDLNPVPPEHKAEVLTTKPRWFINQIDKSTWKIDNGHRNEDLRCCPIERHRFKSCGYLLTASLCPRLESHAWAPPLLGSFHSSIHKCSFTACRWQKLKLGNFFGSLLAAGIGSYNFTWKYYLIWSTNEQNFRWGLNMTTLMQNFSILK
jgi:hypothetical protein